MFGKREAAKEVTMTTASQSIETIIGEGAEFEGTITTKTALRVDGRVKGDNDRVKAAETKQLQRPDAQKAE